MARKTYSPEQIIRKLRETEVYIGEGITAREAARQIGVTEQTYYSWRKEYGGMQISQAKRKRLWLNDGSCIRLRPTHRNHV